MSTHSRIARTVRHLRDALAGSRARTLDGSGTTSHRRGPSAVLAALVLLVVAALSASAASASAPLISVTAASNVTTTGATLTAQLDPGGEPTTYHFDYTTDSDFLANGFAHTTSKPVPDGSAGSASGTVAVSQAISGLQPATAYRFRVVVSNASGADQSSAAFTTYSIAQAFDPCPNDALRTDAGARLPDCRAYEQVSPTAKNGADIQGRIDLMQASTAGEAATFYANGGLPGGTGGQDFPIYISRRDATGWSTRGLLPPAAFGSRATVKGWTDDLSESFVTAGDGFFNPFHFLAQSTATGAISQISPSTNQNFFLAGTSAGGSAAYFQSTAHLTPDSVSGVNLYRWDRDTGALSDVGVLPDSACGVPPCVSSAFAGSYDWFAGTNLSSGGSTRHYYTGPQHAMSVSGDGVFFTARDTGRIYYRSGLNGPSPSTVEISASQASSPDPNGAKPAVFLGATPSGSRAFFTSCERLTDDSTALSTADFDCSAASFSLAGTPPQASDLYAYDTTSGGLTDLTPDATDPRGADVKGVLGTSDDGSHVYFVANGVLAAGATPGDCVGLGGSDFLNFTGSCNLYLSHDGSISFIARLDAGGERSDAMNWLPQEQGQPYEEEKTSRVSADGQTLLFGSHHSLTGYDNNGPRCRSDASGQLAPGPCPELYRYNVDDGVSCVSCNPTGAPPEGAPALASIPSGAVFPLTNAVLQTRNLSSDGDRVIFETPDKLVAADADGGSGCPGFALAVDPVRTCQDVYEWEANGAGSCHSVEQAGGCLYLLSPGTGSTPSFLLDASASGDDVFIYTRDRLVPQDADALVDVYDARVAGGLASQHTPPPPPGCVADACQGSPAPPPADPVSGSSSFSGPGNQDPSHGAATTAPKKKSAPKKKCKKKHHKRTCKKSRRANTNRGGSK